MFDGVVGWDTNGADYPSLNALVTLHASATRLSQTSRIGALLNHRTWQIITPTITPPRTQTR
jgi:hypothetical protein